MAFKGVRLWADKRAAPATEQALERVAALFESEPGVARHGLAMGDREVYLKAIKGKGIFKRAEDAPLVRVSLSELRGIQGTVNKQRLAEYVSEPNRVPEGKRSAGHGGLVDRPVVVRHGGELWVHDGHHRSEAARLLGQRDIVARVVDLDAD